MNYSVLDEKISHLIDQGVHESDNILNEFRLDSETHDCLSRLISKNQEVLNNIRIAIIDSLEK